jgi:DnaK suppressor protein
MEPERAGELLARERTRIQESVAALDRDGPLGSSDRDEPGDVGDQSLYQAEFDAGRREDLRRQLAAVERAEARLADGTYGLSIQSGQPIPDARLEAMPTAERTIEEEGSPGRG